MLEGMLGGCSSELRTQILEKDKNSDRHANARQGVLLEFHNKVIDVYHELLPGLPRVKDWTEARRRLLDARICECVKRGKPATAISYWREFFETVAASDFLCGRKTEWRADLEWLITKKNFTRVIEQKYQNVRATNGGRIHA